MSPRKKLLRNLAIVLTALVAVIFVSAIAIVQTDWFRAYVKQKIITATEEGTGGKVEIGSFTFDWRHLRAAVSDFVVHGTESPGVAPYLRASQVQLIIRPLTSVHHFLDLTYLAIDHPEANIIVFPDGHTNVPTPKGPSSSKSPLETVVDLAVSRFELTNGMITFASEKQQLNVRGNNLHVQLFYNVADQGYHGRLSFEPIYVVSGRNTPVTLAVTLPVALGRDRVTFQDARVTTPHSSIVINGSLNTLRGRPTVSANVKGRIALTDLENAGTLPVNIALKGVPTSIDVDASGTAGDDRIQVIGLHLSLGQSNIEASGTLKDSRGEGILDFKSRLAIGELGRLAKISNRPEGTAILNGRAKLDANNNYRMDGNAQITDVSFQTGARRFTNLSVLSAVSVDAHQLGLNGLRLLAFGGELQGDVSVQEFARYQLRLNARNLDLQAIARMAGQSQFAYGGSVSGPIESSGNLKTVPQGVAANARLTIAPGPRGIPVSGRLSASYDGARNDVRVDNSFLSLPHTRLTMNGSLAGQLNFALTTSDPNDVLAAVPGTSKSPVGFVGGQASFTGTVSGGLSYPQVTGHLAANRFSIEGRQFEKLDADAQVSSTSAALRNGSVTRDKMQAQFGATVGLLNWEPTPNQQLTAEAAIQNGDLADIAVLAGQQGTQYSGMLSANLRVDGAVGNPKGAATLQIMNGIISGQPFDKMQAQIDLGDQVITIPSATVQSGPSNVQLTAEFRYPRDSFTVGEGRAHVQSNQVDLSQLPGLQKVRPNTGGLVQLNADIAGRVSAGDPSTGQVVNDAQHGKQQTQFLLTSVTADATIRGLRSGSQTYGDLTLNARTSEETVSYNLVSNFAGSNIRVNGNTRLTKGFPTTADATLSNLAVERVLALAQRADIPVKGSLSGTAHLSGTMDQPEGQAELELANAVVYEEPVDRLRSRVVYRNQTIDVPQLEVVSGPSRLDLTARYDHPSENLQSGNLQFRVNESRIDLSRIKNLQNRRPGLAGALQIAASGAAEIRSSEPRLLIHDLNAMVKASGISAQGKQFGDLDVNANTSAGKLNFVLDSNLAEASIHGRGTAVLNSDYPVDAQLQFSNVTWTKLQPLLGGSGGPPTFEAISDGQVTVRGPATKVEQLDGSLQISRVRLSTASQNSKRSGRLLLENQGPVSAAMNQGTIRIQSAHLRGPQTDFQATGVIPLRGQSMDLRVNGNVNLTLLKSLSEDVTSSGSVVLDANVHGTISAPLVNGQIELQNATLNYIDFPNGISNANGVVQFNGNSATLRNMTAESGGGKLTVAGFAAMRDELRFGLRVNASDVRVRVQQGVSVVGNGNVNLTGTSRNSVLSGAITISRLNYAPQTDLGSMLVQVAPPVQSPSVSSPILDNMKLDIQIRTTGGTSVQSSLAENLLLDTDLQVRGTATHPGVLGRVNVTNGELVFFGSKYAVESGSIGFFNPVRIEPVLDLTLHTQAKGVDVVLRATGPVDNIKLSYTSDPPLQFQEIVTLLAAGKTPTSDPTLLAKQPSQPAQNFEQMGATALLSKAVADPVANRLQRVFGVSQLKIDPTFTSGSDLPQAQVTIQQQVTSNLTFTYATGLTDANAQTVRVELTLNPQWSASAMRDQNGIFSINLLYKRQLR